MVAYGVVADEDGEVDERDVSGSVSETQKGRDTGDLSQLGTEGRYISIYYSDSYNNWR